MSSARMFVVAAVIVGFGMTARNHAQQPAAPSAADVWSGQISLPTGPLAIIVTLRRDDHGAWTGTIDIPAQRAKGLALGNIVVADRAVSFAIAGVPGAPTFKGALADEGGHLSGTFSQNGATLPFALTRGAAAVATAAAPPPSPVTLPPYADPQRYVEQEVTVGSGEWQLPGTLTMPIGAGPFPAVVLVHGSGPNDRDETLAANKPFRDLALGLASRGIAVLRYEKRTRVYAAKLTAVPNFTVKDEVIDDVVAAVALVRGTPRIDPARVVVLGHSLGGMLVPRIATAAAGVDGFIVMAGPTRPMEQILVEQVEYLARLDGTVSADEQQEIDAVKSIAAAVDRLQPADANGPAMIAGAPASYWLDLRGYDPAAAAQAMTRPMLILQGGRDYQVTSEDFARWKTALAGRPNVTFKTYPALNHLFMAGTGPATPQDYTQPGHVAENVIADIGAWIATLAPAKP